MGGRDGDEIVASLILGLGVWLGEPVEVQFVISMVQ